MIIKAQICSSKYNNITTNLKKIELKVCYLFKCSLKAGREHDAGHNGTQQHHHGIHDATGCGILA